MLPILVSIPIQSKYRAQVTDTDTLTYKGSSRGQHWVMTHEMNHHQFLNYDYILMTTESLGFLLSTRKHTFQFFMFIKNLFLKRPRMCCKQSTQKGSDIF